MLDVNIFDSMRVGLASPDNIRSWSHGEVKKPETINYRTLKPERDGLFCERIFGPTHDWECHCGKYKRVRYKGIICDRCGVEVTRAKVRRERMGHIELAAPVSHIWYFKGIPSRMGLILGITPKNLERVLYFASYIVLEQPSFQDKNFPLLKQQLLSEAEFRRAKEIYGDEINVGIGAEAVQFLLHNLDLDQLASDLRADIHSSSAQKRFRAIRRLEVVEAFRKSGNKPEWMILNVIPVIPPDLRLIFVQWFNLTAAGLLLPTLTTSTAASSIAIIVSKKCLPLIFPILFCVMKSVCCRRLWTLSLTMAGAADLLPAVAIVLSSLFLIC